jgi:hypothetical protein
VVGQVTALAMTATEEKTVNNGNLNFDTPEP